MIYSMANYQSSDRGGPRKPGIPFAEAAKKRRAAVARRVARAVAAGEALLEARRGGITRDGGATARFWAAIDDLDRVAPARAAAICDLYLPMGDVAA